MNYVSFSAKSPFVLSCHQEERFRLGLFPFSQKDVERTHRWRRLGISILAFFYIFKNKVRIMNTYQKMEWKSGIRGVRGMKLKCAKVSAFFHVFQVQTTNWRKLTPDKKSTWQYHMCLTSYKKIQNYTLTKPSHRKLVEAPCKL